MAAYPTSPMWSFPVTRSLKFQTSIATGEDSTEQRCMDHAGRESWLLAYPRLSLAERDLLYTAFAAAHGSVDQTLTLTFLGTTFTRCYFDSDKLAFTEAEPTVYSGTVKVCQVVRAPDSGTVPSSFPALANGCITQRPYVHERAFDNVAVETEGGRYPYYRRSTPLRTWTAGGSVLSTADATTIWDMFRKAGGRYRSFTFTDPESGTSYTARFASDVLDWRMVGPGENAVNVTLQELA